MKQKQFQKLKLRHASQFFLKMFALVALVLCSVNAVWGQTSIGKVSISSEPDVTNTGWQVLGGNQSIVGVWGYGYAEKHQINGNWFVKISSDGFFKIRVYAGVLKAGDILKVEVGPSGDTSSDLGYIVEGSNTFVNVGTGTYSTSQILSYTLKSADIQNDADDTQYDFVKINRSGGGYQYAYHSFELIQSPSVTFSSNNAANGTISASANSSSISSGDHVPAGTTVTFTAAPSSGYNFTGWYNGDTQVSTETSYTATVNSDLALTAKFTEISFDPNFDLSFNKDDASHGSTVTTWDNGTLTVSGSTDNWITVKNVSGHAAEYTGIKLTTVGEAARIIVQYKDDSNNTQQVIKNIDAASEATTSYFSWSMLGVPQGKFSSITEIRFAGPSDYTASYPVTTTFSNVSLVNVTVPYPAVTVDDGYAKFNLDSRSNLYTYTGGFNRGDMEWTVKTNTTGTFASLKTSGTSNNHLQVFGTGEAYSNISYSDYTGLRIDYKGDHVRIIVKTSGGNFTYVAPESVSKTSLHLGWEDFGMTDANVANITEIDVAGCTQHSIEETTDIYNLWLDKMYHYALETTSGGSWSEYSGTGKGDLTYSTTINGKSINAVFNNIQWNSRDNSNYGDTKITMDGTEHSDPFYGTPYCDGLVLAKGNTMVLTAPSGYTIKKVKIGLGHEYSTWVNINNGSDNYNQITSASVISKSYEDASAPNSLTLSIAGNETLTALHVTYITFELLNSAIDESRDVTTSGATRPYWIYVPNSVMTNTSTAVPVVFSLHGAGGDYNPSTGGAQNFNDLADKNGFIVIYPQGRELSFPGWGGTARGWQATGNDSPTNVDVQYLRDIVTALKAENSKSDSERQFMVDESKFYITGFSNGGMMTYAAANVMSDVFAAYAAISGFPVNEMHLRHNGDRAVPFLHIHGQDDNFVKYSHTPTIIDNMVARDGLSYTPSSTTTGKDYTLYKYEADGKQPYYFYSVSGMGHQNSVTLHDESTSTDSREVIWNFFNGRTLNTTKSTVEFATDINTANDDARNHGWTTNEGTILAQYGESGGYTTDGENVYHSIQLNAGNHYFKFNATNADHSKYVTVKITKLGKLSEFDDLMSEGFATTEDIVKEVSYTCQTAQTCFKFTTTEDAEYQITITKGDANDATTISNVSIETTGTTTDNEKEAAASTDFAGWYRYVNRLSVQWNFDECDAYRFNEKNLSSEYWSEDASNVTSGNGTKIFTYKKDIGTQDDDYSSTSNFGELTYDGVASHKIAITAGLLFKAAANNIVIKVTYKDGKPAGTHLVVNEKVQMVIPYVENTFRNDMGSADQPNADNNADFENCVHHWKRDILYVSLETGNVWNTWNSSTGWKQGHILNKCIDDNTLDMFNAGGEEYVNGDHFYKMNYTGNHGTLCVLQFQKETSFNRLGVNRNLTYSFYSEYVSDLGDAYDKPKPRTRIIGSPTGAIVANNGPFVYYEGAIAFSYGGWKTVAESDEMAPSTDDQNLYDYQDYEGNWVTDKWNELCVYNGKDYFMNKENWTVPTTSLEDIPIASDGFPVLSMNNEKATSGSLMPTGTSSDEMITVNSKSVPNYHPLNDGKLYVGSEKPYKANITPWSLPSRGAYLKFEPSYPGVLNVHILQKPNAVYYIADEFGVPQGAADVFTKTASYSNTITKVDENGGTTGDLVAFKLKGTQDYVKYSFNVYPGKTYYMFSNDAGMGFAGFYFEPYVERKEVTDEFGREDVNVYNVTLDGATDYTFPTLNEDGVTNGIKTVSSPKASGGTEDYKIHYSQKAVKVTLERSFKANTWNSICLPYSMNQVQMDAVFGSGTRVVLVRDLQSAEHSENNKVTLNLVCHENQDIIAGYPYFILPTKDVSKVVTYACLDKFPQHTGNVPTLVSVSSEGLNFNSYEDKTYGGISDFTFKGTLSNTTVKKNSYYVGGGKLKRLTAESATLNPYRAWINADVDNPSWAKSIQKVVGMDADLDDFDDDATGIDINELLANQGIFVEKADVYSTDGRLVRANAENLNNLPKGVYIVNGKKYFVK